MLLELKLVSRSILSRRRSLAKITSTAAVLGLGVGVAGLMIAQALAAGYRENLETGLLANTPHITVLRRDGGDISDWNPLTVRIKTIANVRNVAGAAAENVFVIGAAASDHAVLQTFDMERVGVVSGAVPVWIGTELGKRVGLGTGDAGEIVVLRNGTETRRMQVTVADVFSTGFFDQDSTSVRVSPADFAALYGDTEFTPRSLDITVNDIYVSDTTARLVSAQLGDDFRVIDWQEANRPLFAALRLEKKVAMAMVLLIILIAALNITATLALLVNEHRLDIAVLRTCGAKGRSLIAIFMLEGLLLGAVGIVGGVVAGLAACRLANSMRLIGLPGEVYPAAYVTLDPRAYDTLLIAGIALAICLAATFYPAFIASRIKPMENFRIR